MPNGKALFIILLVAGLFIAALVSRQAYLILLALPLLTYFMMGILRSPGDIQLQTSRHTSRSAGIVGESVEMRVTVQNNGNSPAYFILQDSLFQSMNVAQGKSSRFVYLAPGEQKDLTYIFRARRGLYAWKTIRVIPTDLFSLFEQVKVHPARAEVLIGPAPARLRHIPLRPFITRHIPGSMPARLAGSGTNFFSLREYRPGDSLRKIHWRGAARHPGELFTKEFEQDEIADIGVILDARALEGDGLGEDSLFEHAVSATSSLAELFLQEGNRVGLLVFGIKMTAIYPSNGKKHLHLIYRTLAQTQAGRNIPLDFLSYFSHQLFPRQSMVFVISPLQSRDLPTYTRLSAEGYQVVLISPDPINYSSRDAPAESIHSLAYRAARLERNALLRQLLNLGIQVVDWTTDRLLNDVLHEKLVQPAVGHPRRINR
jgi:uncharacterized protein (DUF58 family)